MQHPFESIKKNRKKVFISLLVTTLLIMFIMNFIAIPLTTEAAPQGIVSFELAGGVSTSQEILDSWDTNAQMHAAYSLGLDYLFLLLYSSAIALACVWTGEILRDNHWPLSSLAIPLAWSLWVAAFLDIVENISLSIILFGTNQVPWPEIARVSALIKFAFVFLGLVYAFFGLVAYLTRRFT